MVSAAGWKTEFGCICNLNTEKVLFRILQHRQNPGSRGPGFSPPLPLSKGWDPIREFQEEHFGIAEYRQGCHSPPAGEAGEGPSSSETVTSS